MTSPVVSLEVLGTPQSRQRPRVTRNGSFTPAQTRNWYAAIRAAWDAAGRPRLPDAPLALEVTARFGRPPGHFRKDGGLTAAGRRAIPGGTRDADSVTVSPVMDALEGCCWSSDRFFVSIHGEKAWARRGEPDCLTVLAWCPSPDDVARPA